MSGYVDPLTRAMDNFYRKIRHFLEDVEDKPDFVEPQPPMARFSNPSEPRCKLYGEITPAEMEKIFEAYQKNEKLMKDLPITCDGIQPNSYEKLLYSKPGFHHINSTNYLLEELGIKDYTRNSFLGGFSNYDVKDEDHIDGLRRENKEIRFKLSLRDFDKFLQEGKIEDCRKIIDELCEIDYEHPDLLYARGQLYVNEGRYENAVRVLERSYNHKNSESTAKFISECFYKIGIVQFHRNKWELALENFKRSIDYNKENHGSRMHVEHCIKNITARQKEFTPKPAYRK